MIASLGKWWVRTFGDAAATPCAVVVERAAMGGGSGVAGGGRWYVRRNFELQIRGNLFFFYQFSIIFYSIAWPVFEHANIYLDFHLF